MGLTMQEKKALTREVSKRYQLDFKVYGYYRRLLAWHYCSCLLLKLTSKSNPTSQGVGLLQRGAALHIMEEF
jgi:hypothetical protein